MQPTSEPTQKNRLITKLKRLIKEPANNKPKQAPKKSQTKTSKVRLKAIQRAQQQETLKAFSQRLKSGNQQEHQDIFVGGLTKEENKKLNEILKGEHER